MLDLEPKDPDATAIAYLGPEAVAAMTEQERLAMRAPWWIVVFVGMDATVAVVDCHRLMHLEMTEWGTAVDDILTLPAEKGFHKWTGNLEVSRDYYGEADEKWVGKWEPYDHEAEEILNMSDEHVEQELRELGLDPEQVGKDGRAFVEKTIRRHEATKRIRAVLPHLDMAGALAKVQAPPGAEVKLAIVAKNADGSGKMGAMFEFQPFITDLLHLIGFEDMTALLKEEAEIADAIDQG